jgi:hypothetical protein
VAYFKVLSRYSSSRTEENHEKIIQVSRSSGRDLNQGSPERRSRSVDHWVTEFGGMDICPRLSVLC